MALSSEQLSNLDQLLSGHEGDANPLSQIRAGLPGVSITRCDFEDMRGEAAFRRSGQYDVFLVDASNHCWRIIDDPQAATGVVVAKYA